MNTRAVTAASADSPQRQDREAVTDPSTTPDETPVRSNLQMRIMAALVLAPLALAAAWFGGWFWTILVTLTVVGLFGEWMMVIGNLRPNALMWGFAALGVAGLVLGYGSTEIAHLIIALGLFAMFLFSAREHKSWAAIGLAYTAAPLFSSILLRKDPVYGLQAIIFVFAVVWITDIMGYFVGRSVGGPKLWVRVSPKKTWSGAAGGIVGSMIFAAAFAESGYGALIPMLMLATVISIISQAGDLFESAVKRRFDVKDSSQIIPGHGGLLDRLDGFMTAILAAAIIGYMRGGIEHMGKGFLVW
jgi:phosphatidate cytidylyltransferase